VPIHEKKRRCSKLEKRHQANEPHDGRERVIERTWREKGLWKPIWFSAWLVNNGSYLFIEMLNGKLYR